MPNSGNNNIGGGRKAALAAATSNGEKTISKKRSSAGGAPSGGGMGGAGTTGDQQAVHSHGPSVAASGSVGEGSGGGAASAAHPSAPPRPMSISSDEVNFLVYRFLQEAGFVHSAFTFAYESMVGNTSLSRMNIPPGALITFLQKGLQYVGIEETLRQEEEQRMEVDSVGAGASANSHRASRMKDNGVGGEQPIDFTLLSPHTVQALTRRDPPIRIQIPSAHATAAIQSRINSSNSATGVKRSASALSSSSQTYPKVPRNSPVNSNSQIPTSKVTSQQSQQQHGTRKQAQQSSSKPLEIDRVGSTSTSQHNPNGYNGQQALHQRQTSTQQKQNPTHSKQKETSPNHNSRAASNDSRSGAAQQARSVHQQAGHTNADPNKGTRAGEITSASQLLQIQKQANAHHTQQSNKQQQQQPPAQKQSIVQTGLGERSISAENHQQQTQPKAKVDTEKQTAVKMNGADTAQEVKLVNGMKSGVSQPMQPPNNQLSKPNTTAPARNSTQNPHSDQSVHNPSPNGTSEESQAGSAEPALDIIDQEDMLTQARPEEVLELNKHTSEVFMCAWNPIFTNLLATGSGDASARIWTMGGTDARSGTGQCKLLNHGSNTADRKNKDVTTLEWSTNGKHLATGSYDGVARIWTERGVLEQTLRGHTGPIFSLKWNKRGNFLLSGSYDKTTIVWDVSSGIVKQQFNHHMAPALDVDWKDDVTFASCSTDKTVLICRVGFAEPLHRFVGHTDEVNAVKWDPSGTLLASCSDDYTAKVWDVSSNKAEPMHDFKSHKQEIYTVKWSPTGQGSANPNRKLRLATASFDGSVRLWDVQSGACIQILSRHRDSVYSVSFSPSGEYLASGSLAGQLYIWRIRDGKHVKNFKGQGDIFEVAWNVEETRVAACFSSNVVNVIDFKI